MRAGLCVRELYYWWWMCQAAAHQTSTRARCCQSRHISSASHLTQHLWNSDGHSWHRGRTDRDIKAYPNKLISTISARFLLIDPWSSPQVWRRTAAGHSWEKAAFGRRTNRSTLEGRELCVSCVSVACSAFSYQHRPTFKIIQEVIQPRSVNLYVSSFCRCQNPSC